MVTHWQSSRGECYIWPPIWGQQVARNSSSYSWGSTWPRGSWKWWRGIRGWWQPDKSTRLPSRFGQWGKLPCCKGWPPRKVGQGNLPQHWHWHWTLPTPGGWVPKGPRTQQTCHLCLQSNCGTLPWMAAARLPSLNQAVGTFGCGLGGSSLAEGPGQPRPSQVRPAQGGLVQLSWAVSQSAHHKAQGAVYEGGAAHEESTWGRTTTIKEFCVAARVHWWRLLRTSSEDGTMGMLITTFIKCTIDHFCLYSFLHRWLCVHSWMHLHVPLLNLVNVNV